MYRPCEDPGVHSELCRHGIRADLYPDFSGVMAGPLARRPAVLVEVVERRVPSGSRGGGSSTWSQAGSELSAELGVHVHFPGRGD